MTTAYDFSLTSIDGKHVSLADYRGKTLLIVNVASKCGLTPQYEGLEALYRSHKDRGLVVLGLPCNQFMGQEPGTEAEIASFCRTNYDVSFPLFAKLEVNGEGRHPLFAWLTTQDVGPEAPGDVKWNFGKFLVDREGKLVARFAPTVKPEARELVSALDSALV